MNKLLKSFQRAVHEKEGSVKDKPVDFTKKFRCKICSKEYSIAELNPRFPDICFDAPCPGKGKTGKLEEIFIPNGNNGYIRVPAAPALDQAGIQKMLITAYENEEKKATDRYSPFYLFIFWCAGVFKTEINALSSDRLRYQLQGIVIIGAGLLSALSGGYALYYVFYDISSVVERTLFSIIFGLLWGFIILNIDRSVIIGFSNKAPAKKKLAMALPRLVLAISISFVIAVPLELQILKGTIDDANKNRKNEEVNVNTKEYHNRIDSRNNQINGYLDNSQNLRKEVDLIIKQKTEDYNTNRPNGNWDGAKQKKFTEKIDSLNALINNNSKLVAGLNRENNSDIEFIQRKSDLIGKSISPSESLPERLKILSKASADSAVFWTRFVIQLLFIIVECFPVLMKLLQSPGPFDDYRELVAQEVAKNVAAARQVNEESRLAWQKAETLRSATESRLYREAIEEYVKKLKNEKIITGGA